MLELGAELNVRDMTRRPLDEAELRELIGDRPVERFLSARNELYGERDMKMSPPTHDEAIRLMAEHPNLLRRPIARRGERLVIDCGEAGLRDLVGAGR